MPKIIAVDWIRCGGHFDLDTKVEELKELDARTEDPSLWDNPDEAQKIMQQKTSLERTINGFNKTLNTLEEASMLFEMGMEENDQDSKLEAVAEIDKVQKDVEAFELAQMLGGETDA